MNKEERTQDDQFEPFLPPRPGGGHIFSPRGLGPAFRSVIVKAAAAVGTHPRFLLTALIVLCAGLLGTRTRYRIGPTWHECTTILALLVGPSGSGKSRSFVLAEPTLRSIYEAENVGAPDHNDPGARAVFAARLKAYGDACVEADLTGAPKPKLDPETRRYDQQLGDYPIVITDLTPAGLLRGSVASRHGVIVMSDEIAAKLVGKAGEGLRDELLKGYDQAHVRKDLSRSTLEGCMAVCMLGATTTDRAIQLGLERGDGLTGRMLLSLSNGPVARVHPEQIEPEAVKIVQDWLHLVRKMTLPADIGIDNAGWSQVEQSVSDLRKTVVGSSAGLVAAVERAGAQIVRIAGALSVLYRADEIRRQPTMLEREQPIKVSAEALRAATLLYTDHYIPSLIAVLDQTAAGLAKPLGLRFVEALIERHGTDRVTLRELGRRPGNYGIREAELSELQTVLVGNGVARIEATEAGAAGGRPSRSIVLTAAFRAAYDRRKAKIVPDGE